jgi:hypothetical protein
MDGKPKSMAQNFLSGDAFRLFLSAGWRSQGFILTGGMARRMTHRSKIPSVRRPEASYYYQCVTRDARRETHVPRTAQPPFHAAQRSEQGSATKGERPIRRKKGLPPEEDCIVAKNKVVEPATKKDRSFELREVISSMVFYECVVTTKNTCRKLDPNDVPRIRVDSLSHCLSLYRLSFLNDPDETAVS